MKDQVQSFIRIIQECKSLYSLSNMLTSYISISFKTKTNKYCVSDLMLIKFHPQTPRELSLFPLIVEGMGLGCLMTPGVSKDIQCHVLTYFSKVSNHQIRHQVTYKVGCQPGDSYIHFNLLQGFVWVCVG